MTGRRIFGSSYGRRNYKNYGSSKSGQQQSDIEMSFQARKRAVKDPNGLTFLDQTEVGSEESILRAKEDQKSDAGGVTGDTRHHSLTPGARGIVRTDVITVSHSSASHNTPGGVDYQDRRHF